MGIIAKRSPLREKGVLGPAPESHLLGKFGFVKLRLPIIPVFLGPSGPGSKAIVDFQHHEKGIIFQPGRLLPRKCPIGFVGVETGVGQPQRGITGLEKPAVIHALAAVAVLPQFGWGQQAIGRQTLQVDKIGISGGGARGLVRAIAIGGRIQRQYLPAGLTGGVEKIHKIIGFAAETADAVFSRQAADGHNDTGFVGKTEIFL